MGFCKRTLAWGLVLMLAIALGACSKADDPSSAGNESGLEPTPAVTLELPSVTEAAVTPEVGPMPTAEVAPVPEPESVPDPVVELPNFESEQVARIAAGLSQLLLDDFFEQSYLQLALRSPESVTSLGMAAELGLRHDQLDNLSHAYQLETYELNEAILFLLRQYDRDAYSPEQKLTIDVYEWWLDDRLRGREFMHYDYVVHHFLGAYHDTRVRLFTEIHPMTSKQDAEDYIARLWAVADQAEQVLDNLVLAEQAGIVPPSFIVQATIEAMSDYLRIDGRDPSTVPAQELSVYTVFGDKLDAIPDLSQDEKRDLTTEAAAAVEASFVPAYVALLQQLDYLATIATDDAGAWKFPQGDAYYAYRIRNQTSTEMSPEQIHQLGLAEVERVQNQMREIFTELGYPAEESFSQLMQRVRDDAGYMDMRDEAGKERVLARYEEILDEVDARLDDYFDIRPQAEVVVVGGPDGGYYVPGSADGSRPGAFHVATIYDWSPSYRMAPLAYHEAIPGHHFQIAIAQELDLPFLRTDLFFNGYAEGWALYAEQLAWEMGMYENDPYGNLGRLEYELLRSIRLVVDTGIHAMGWTAEEAHTYGEQALGRPPGSGFWEVNRYIVLPAQALGYKLGMLKILELRQRAMDQLGHQFDIKEFHRVVLGNGAVPLEILERLVDEYIAAKLADAGNSTDDGGNRVQGWAVLAQKDDYSDVDMTDILVDHIGLTQLRQVLLDAGWSPDQIVSLPEFDRASLQESLDWLEANAGQDDVVLLYVAAHGRYLRDVLQWADFFAAEWTEIASSRRVLVIDSCEAGDYTAVIDADPGSFVSVAAVAGDEYGWSGLEEEGLPIIGGVFTHYFAAAFADPAADGDGDGYVSVQEAAGVAEPQQRDYMHQVVFAVPEFVESFHAIGAWPDEDPGYPHVVLNDTYGEPLILNLNAYP